MAKEPTVKKTPAPKADAKAPAVKKETKAPAKKASAKAAAPVEQPKVPAPLSTSITFATNDRNDVLPDLSMIKQSYRHTIDGLTYMVVGFTWLQIQDAWGILLMERYVSNPVPIAIPYADLTAEFEDGTPKYTPSA